jgi:alpha-beta hydrolase superfamily lysophospholipase
MKAFSSTQSVLYFAAGFLVAAGMIFFIRWLIFRWLGYILFPAQAKGRITPADASLEYDDFLIPTVGNRTLKAWYVHADGNSIREKAVLIYPGRKQTISDWVPAMAYLWRRGISSMVFDYSDHNNGSSKTNLANLYHDAQNAYLAFVSHISPNARKYLVGSSTGVGPLLQAATTLECEVDGLFFIAPFVSIREAISHLISFPKFLAFLVPEVFNNLKLVPNLCVPLVLIHSQEDEVFPAEMSERIYLAAHEPKYLVLLHGLRHHDMLQGKEAEYLAPIADLIN